ncbi:IPTL-CTERM sorting domain-containing protein [Comamonas sp. B21-038]|uniref:IPTL-CTERM sorting domain-containing protein n=1 Tax=Comamonas sp. B21-038 TaxID=2918299 RepID=UPI001EFBF69E|nr:IPTL-CTERM sorting domain-containing protein [Comamonas sp. B21-038]ULR89759.1 IPTL-CTERM sorting domain-containing protein [Comamonas sp. B21-038]
MKFKTLCASTLATVALTAVSTSAFSQAFTQNFDDISLLSGLGWVMQNSSAPVGSLGWFQGIATNATPTPGPFNSYNGPVNSYIAANFSSTGSTGTISNWLIAPNRTLRNGDVVTFYTRKPTIGGGQTDYPDRLEVRLSTNGASTSVGAGATAVGDFSTLLLSINPTLIANVYPQVWTQYSITISGLPAPTSGRAAFRYFVTGAGSAGSNSDYIGIDNVVYTPYVCPTFTMTSGGAISGGIVGQAFSSTLSQTGALGTPSFAITAGALPPGLTQSSSGLISGTPTSVGTYSFTTTVSDASGCSGSQSYSISVDQGGQSISFPSQSPASQLYTPGGSFSINPQATASTLLPVSYDSSTPAVCTVAGSNVSINSAGICTLVALQAGDANYTAAPSQSQSVTIDKASQTISFSSFPPPNAQVGGSYNVAANGGASGNAISFSVDSGSLSVCSISGTLVSFNGAGNCSINANQLGNANYSDAIQVQQTVSIGQGGSGVSISSSQNPSQPGQAVTFTVSVAFDPNKSAALQAKAAPVPTGTVEIMDGATSLGSAGLVNGVATITAVLPGTAVTHSLVANYSGDANYPAGQSEAFIQSIAATAPTPVPSLSQWALALLSLVLGGFAAMGVRRSRMN